MNFFWYCSVQGTRVIIRPSIQNIVLSDFFPSTFERMIMNIELYTNYINKLINECIFGLK